MIDILKNNISLVIVGVVIVLLTILLILLRNIKRTKLQVIKTWITESTKNKVITGAIVTTALALVLTGTYFTIRHFNKEVEVPIISLREDIENLEANKLTFEFTGEEIEVKLEDYFDNIPNTLLNEDEDEDET